MVPVIGYPVTFTFTKAKAADFRVARREWRRLRLRAGNLQQAELHQAFALSLGATRRQLGRVIGHAA